MLGGRPASLVFREALSARNYRALVRMARRSPDFPKLAQRYFLGGGKYPWSPRVRTPTGVVAPMLWSHHDVWTLSEVFFREDYAAPADLAVAVDIGSNIGISALYFLTRNRNSRCFLYEPDPKNVERLLRNLDAFAGRFELEQCAVLPRADEAVTAFSPDVTGRYGSVGGPGATIEVPALDINELLERVLRREPAIDLLKLDTEGLERATVAAIRPDLLEAIELIYFESNAPAPLHGDRFAHRFANETVRLSGDWHPNTRPDASR